MSGYLDFRGQQVPESPEALDALLPHMSEGELESFRELYQTKARSIREGLDTLSSLERELDSMREKAAMEVYRDPEKATQTIQQIDAMKAAVQQKQDFGQGRMLEVSGYMERLASEGDTGFWTKLKRESLKPVGTILQAFAGMDIFNWRTQRGFSGGWGTPILGGGVSGDVNGRFYGSFYTDAFAAVTGIEDQGVSGYIDRFMAGGGVWGLVESSFLTNMLATHGGAWEGLSMLRRKGFTKEEYEASAVRLEDYGKERVAAFLPSALVPLGAGASLRGAGKVAQGFGLTTLGKGLQAAGGGRLLQRGLLRMGASRESILAARKTTLPFYGALAGGAFGYGTTVEGEENSFYDRVQRGMLGAMGGFAGGKALHHGIRNPRLFGTVGGAAWGALSGEDTTERIRNAAIGGALGFGAGTVVRGVQNAYKVQKAAKMAEELAKRGVTPEVAKSVLEAGEGALPESEVQDVWGHLLNGEDATPQVRALLENGKEAEAVSLLVRNHVQSRNSLLSEAVEASVLHRIVNVAEERIRPLLGSPSREMVKVRRDIIKQIFADMPDEMRLSGKVNRKWILGEIHRQFPEWGLALDPKGRWHPTKTIVEDLRKLAGATARAAKTYGERSAADAYYTPETIQSAMLATGLEEGEARAWMKQLLDQTSHTRAANSVLMGDLLHETRAAHPPVYQIGDVVELPKNAAGGARPFKWGKVKNIVPHGDGYAYELEKSAAPRGKPKFLKIPEKDLVPVVEPLADDRPVRVVEDALVPAREPAPKTGPTQTAEVVSPQKAQEEAVEAAGKTSGAGEGLPTTPPEKSGQEAVQAVPEGTSLEEAAKAWASDPARQREWVDERVLEVLKQAEAAGLTLTDDVLEEVEKGYRTKAGQYLEQVFLEKEAAGAENFQGMADESGRAFRKPVQGASAKRDDGLTKTRKAARGGSGESAGELSRQSQDDLLVHLGFDEVSPIPYSRARSVKGNKFRGELRNLFLEEGGSFDEMGKPVGGVLNAHHPKVLSLWENFVNQPAKETQSKVYSFFKDMEKFFDDIGSGLPEAFLDAFRTGGRVKVPGASKDLYEATVGWALENLDKINTNYIHKFFHVSKKGVSGKELNRVMALREARDKAVTEILSKSPDLPFEEVQKLMGKAVPQTTVERIRAGLKGLSGHPGAAAMILAPIPDTASEEEQDTAMAWKMAALMGALILTGKVHGDRTTVRAILKSTIHPLKEGASILRKAAEKSLAEDPNRIFSGRLKDILEVDGALEAAGKLVTGLVEDVTGGAEKTVFRGMGEVIKFEDLSADGWEGWRPSRELLGEAPFVLRDSHSVKFGRWEISRAPRIMTKEDFIRAGGSSDQFISYTTLLRKRLASVGFTSTDIRPANVGLIHHKGKFTPYLIDSGGLKSTWPPLGLIGEIRASRAELAKQLRNNPKALILLGGGVPVAGEALAPDDDGEEAFPENVQEAGFSLRPVLDIIRRLFVTKLTTRETEKIAANRFAEMIVMAQQGLRASKVSMERSYTPEARKFVAGMAKALEANDAATAAGAQEMARAKYPLHSRTGPVGNTWAHVGASMDQRAMDPERAGQGVAAVFGAAMDRSLIKRKYLDPMIATINQGFREFSGERGEVIYRAITEGTVETAGLSEVEKAFAYTTRYVSDMAIQLQNLARERMGMKPIEYSENYIKRIFDGRVSDEAWRLSPETTIQAIYNTNGKPRKGVDGYLMDPVRALHDMLQMAFRDALYSPVLKDFDAQAPMMNPQIRVALRGALKEQFGLTRNMWDDLRRNIVGGTYKLFGGSEKGVDKAKRLSDIVLATQTMAEYSLRLGGSMVSVTMNSVQPLLATLQMHPKRLFSALHQMTLYGESATPGAFLGGYLGLKSADEDDSTLGVLGKTAAGALAFGLAGKGLSKALVRGSAQKRALRAEMEKIWDDVLVLEGPPKVEYEQEVGMAFRALTKIHDISLGGFQAVEEFNRRTVALMGWEDATEKGLQGIERIDHARRMVGASQFWYLPMSRPGIFRSAGILERDGVSLNPFGSHTARPFTAFKSFPWRATDIWVNQVEQAMQAAAKGDWKTFGAISGRTAFGLTSIWGLIALASGFGIHAEDQVGFTPLEIYNSVSRRGLGAGLQALNPVDSPLSRLMKNATAAAMSDPEAIPFKEAVREYVLPTQARRVLDYVGVPGVLRPERLAPMGTQGDMVFISKWRGQRRGANVQAPAGPRARALATLGFQGKEAFDAEAKAREIREENDRIESGKIRLLTEIKAMILRRETGPALTKKIRELRGYYPTRDRMLQAIAVSVQSGFRDPEQRALQSVSPLTRLTLRRKEE